jgi:hypothetical protein
MPPGLRLTAPAGAPMESPQAAADYEDTPAEDQAQRAGKPAAAAPAATSAPPPPAPPNASLEAWSPGWGERIHNLIRNSPIGHAVQTEFGGAAPSSPLGGVVDWLRPTTQQGSEEYQSELQGPRLEALTQGLTRQDAQKALDMVRMGYIPATGGLSLLLPKTVPQGVFRETPASAPTRAESVATGVAKAGSAFVSAPSIATQVGIAATGGLLGEALAAPLVPVVAGKITHALIAAGFTGQMIHGVLQDFTQYHKAKDLAAQARKAGDAKAADSYDREANELIGSMGLNGTLAALGTVGAAVSARGAYRAGTGLEVDPGRVAEYRAQQATSRATDAAHPSAEPRTVEPISDEQLVENAKSELRSIGEAATEQRLEAPGPDGRPKPVVIPARLLNFDETERRRFLTKNLDNPDALRQDHNAKTAPAAPPIGAPEPETGRPVLQQSARPEVNQAAATAEHPAVKDQLAEAVKPIAGAEVSGAREAKEPARVDEKIEEEGQSPRTVRDYSGFRIAVDSPAARDQVIASLRARFEVPDVQDEFDQGNAETGFHGTTVQVREPGSPVTHEVQILPREVAENADAHHDIYEKARDGDADAAAELKAANEQDWKAFVARNEGAQASGGIPAITTSSGESSRPLSSASVSAPPARQALEGASQVSRTDLAPSTLTRSMTPGSVSVGGTSNLGAIEPASGKIIHQPEGDYHAQMERAQAAVPDFNRTLDDLAERFGGRSSGVSLKGESSVQAKLARGYPPHGIPDYIRARLVFDSMDEIRQALTAIKQEYGTHDVEEFLDPPRAGGYRAAHLQIGLPNGATAELQLLPREIAEVQEDAHKFYETWRSPDATPDEKAAAQKEIARLFARAHANYTERVAGEPAEGGVAPREVQGGAPPAAAVAAPAEGLKPGEVGRVPLGELKLDPKRFQYKLNVGEQGTTNLLEGRRWNEKLAGVIMAWRDPADGETYVVNGHHRYGLAKANGRPDIRVLMSDAPDAAHARVDGALQNIAEGRGTAIDAAKFFRVTGMSQQELEGEGVSLREATAQNGLALSRLDQSLFDQVVSGKLAEARAVAIGSATDDPAEQEAILKLIDKAEAKGRHVTNNTVNELARMVKGAGQVKESQATLFGEQEMTRSLALEKAEVSDYIRREIQQQRRTFEGVSTEAKAAALGKVKGQTIRAGANAKVAQEAAQAQELYDRLSIRSGTIDDILNRAARDLAEGKKPNEVKQNAYNEARTALSQAVTGRENPLAPAAQEGAPRPATGEPGVVPATAAAAGGEPVGARPVQAGAPEEATRRVAWKAGRQSTPVEVKGAGGDWQPGTLEHYNPGFNGAKASGRVTLDDGTTLRNVAPEGMRLSQESTPAAKTGGPWIGVDLDRTLAQYSGYKGPADIGEPIPAMVERVKRWLGEGKDVRIFTARVADDTTGEARAAIDKWTEKNLGRKLPVTNVKDDKMTALYDDRAVHVASNSGAIDSHAEAQALSPTGTIAPTGTPEGHWTQLEEPARVAKFNETRDAAKARSERENAAQAQPAMLPTPHGKMLALDPDSSVLWHRVFAKVKDADGHNVLGAGVNWRGMSLGPRLVNMAAYFLRDRAGKLADEDPAAAAGYLRMAKALEEAKNDHGGVSVLRGDYRDDTMREEAMHAWDRRHRLSDSEAMRTMAQDPLFQGTADRLRAMQYGLKPGIEGETELAAEMIGKALAGDADLALTPQQRMDLAGRFLSEAVRRDGPQILADLPETDATIKPIIDDLRRGIPYGPGHETGVPEGEAAAPGGPVRPGGLEPGRENRPGNAGRPAGEPGGGGEPPRPGVQPGGQEAGQPEGELAAQFQRAKAAAGLRPEDSLALPGMEGTDEERAAAAAEAQGQRLTEAMKAPLGDISQKAGNLERESPLFFGKGANPDLFSQTEKPGEGPKTLFDDSKDYPGLFQRDQEDTPEFKKWFADSAVKDDAGAPRVLYHVTPSDFSEFNTEPRPAANKPVHSVTDRIGAWFAGNKDFAGGVYDWYMKRQGKELEGPDFAPRTMPVYLSIEHPLEVKDAKMLDHELEGWAATELQKTAPPELRAAPTDSAGTIATMQYELLHNAGLKGMRWGDVGAVARMKALAERAGYDGIHIEDDKNLGDAWIAFRPEQIKSALGNTGAFSRENPDIRFQTADGKWAPFEQQPNLPFAENKEAPRDHIATLDALTDSLARRAAAQPEKSALSKVADWSKSQAETSVDRAGKFWGGVPGAFRQALSWTKATGAALARDWTASGIEQSGWKDGQKELTLASNESAQKIMAMARPLHELIPDEKLGTAAAIWAEADGDEATLRQWAEKAKISKNHDASEYEAALNLPKELHGVVKDIRADLDEMGATGQRTGLINLMRRDYVQHMLDTVSALKAERLIDASELNPNPSFAKQRFYRNFFDAEANGEKFQTKDIRRVVAAYHDSFNKAMASRTWLRSMLMNREADGRPTFVLKSKGPWVEVPDDQLPQIVKQGERPTSLDGYEIVDRPQLRNFLFKPTEEDLLPYIDDPKLFRTGKENYAIKGDLMVHPDRLKAVKNMLTPDWFHRGGAGTYGELFQQGDLGGILQKTGRGIQKVSSLVKEINTFSAPFHVVTEAENAAEAWTNPFKIKPIDLTNDVDRLGAQNMALYHFDREGLFGARTLHGLLHGFPGLSNVADLVNKQSDWMFEHYIPSLKMDTFRKWFTAGLKHYPDLTRDQVAEVTGKAVDARYGNINHALDRMPRNKTAQAVARLGLFAPDFLEARARTVLGAFGKYGGEQRRALARGLLMLYVTPRIVNAAMNHGDAKWDWHDMFSVVIPKPRASAEAPQQYWRFSIKSPFTEMLQLVTNPRMFLAARENPLTARPALKFLLGRDDYGRQLSAQGELKDFFTGTSPFLTQKIMQSPDESIGDSLLSAIGAHMTNYRSPTEQKVHDLYLKTLPASEEDPEKAAESRRNRQLEDAIREGTKSPAEAWKLVEEGKMTPDEAARTTERAQKSRLEIEFASLPLGKAMDIYEGASVAEKAQLHAELDRKHRAVDALPEADRQAAEARLDNLLSQGPE